MMNYIAKLYEKDLQAIRDMYTEKGDLGDVAAEWLQNTPYLFKLQSTQLTVGEIIQVYNTYNKFRQSTKLEE